jgi:hypothetical protein
MPRPLLPPAYMVLLENRRKVRTQRVSLGDLRQRWQHFSVDSQKPFLVKVQEIEIVERKLCCKDTEGKYQ